MPGKDIIVIGASAGGIDALRTIAAGLPAAFDATLFIVIHSAADSPAVIAAILAKAGPLPAEYSSDYQSIERGHIYVAPPDHHLILTPGRMRLTRGPKENRFRPAVDPLFRSAAQTYGPRTVGVVLTGGLDDGTNGLWTIKKLGGTAIVQDPKEALDASMPRSALRYVNADYVVGVSEIASLLVRLAETRADAPEGELTVPEDTRIEVDIAKEHNAKESGVLKLGEPSKYACPECHGVLLKMRDGIPPRFRCHTGHAYTLDSLLADMDEAIEDSLWNAIRSMEERVMLLRDAATHFESEHGDGMATDLAKRAAETQERANLVRQAVMSGGSDSEHR